MEESAIKDAVAFSSTTRRLDGRVIRKGRSDRSNESELGMAATDGTWTVGTASASECRVVWPGK
jgi:hypothetical protein